MRTALAAVLLCAITSAHAKDLTIHLDEGQQNSLTAAAAQMSLCVGDVVLYRNAANCEAVAQALRGVAALIAAAKAEAAKVEPPPAQ
jgi:hypothetical protein